MQTTKNMNFHAYACIVPVQVLIYSFATSTHVCNVFSIDFVKKSRCPGLNVVSDPRIVLRHKQGRLKM